MTAFIQTSARTRVVGDDDETAARRERVVTALKALSRKSHSFAFEQLANMASVDPSAKTKSMITEMIEKLMNEANEEATQKAF